LPLVLRTLLTALPVLLVGLVLAGCGGSERLEYERDLAQVGRVVERALEALPQDESQTISAEQVGVLADELDEAADQLADLDPPKDATRAQRRLERGLRAVAKTFADLSGRLAAAQSDGQKSAVFVDFETDLKADAAFEDILAAQEAYTREGYRVFRAKQAASDTGSNRAPKAAD